MRLNRLLEQEGLASFRRKAQQYARTLVRDAVKQINDHTTAELEKHMATLNEALDRLTTAMTNEFAQIRAEAQAQVDALTADLAAADAANTDLTASLEAQIASNTSLVGTIDSATARVEAVAADLEANDPAVEPPPEEPAGV